jgi:hypothetical protein
MHVVNNVAKSSLQSSFQFIPKHITIYVVI